MTGEERADLDLNEADAREIITKRLEWVYSQRTREILALFVPAGLAWMFYFIYVSAVDHILTLNPAMLISIGITVLCLILFILMTIVINRYRDKLTRAIARKSEKERRRLLPGLDTEFQIITRYVFRPFQKELPSPKYPLFLSEQAALVARNLDWYLTEPRRLIRFSWVSLYVVILVLLILFGYLMYIVRYTGMSESYIVGFSMASFWLFMTLQNCVFLPLCQRYEAIRVEVYRDFVLDWYKRHPLEDGETPGSAVNHGPSTDRNSIEGLTDVT